MPKRLRKYHCLTQRGHKEKAKFLHVPRDVFERIHFKFEVIGTMAVSLGCGRKRNLLMAAKRFLSRLVVKTLF